MPLIECPECKNQVSDKAANCPKCGYPLTKTTVETPVKEPTTTSPTVVTVYTPVVPPRKVRSIGIILGLLLAGFGFWMLTSLLPSHDPRSIDLYGVVAGNWYFNPAIFGPLKTFAVVLIILGIAELILGSTKRVGKLAFCPKCNLQVVAKKKSGKWNCERCDSIVK